MKYNKPEVTVLAAAVDAIQSSTLKIQHVVFDQEIRLATNAAYEADE